MAFDQRGAIRRHVLGGQVRYYLQYWPTFRWRTDKDALHYVKTMNCLSGIIDRWLNTIADFHFKVKHRAGKKHTNTDGTSHLPSTGGSTEDGEEGTDTVIASLDQPRPFHTRYLFQHNRDELHQLQKDDDDLAAARAWVKRGSPLTKLESKAPSSTGRTYVGLYEQLQLVNGLLRYTYYDQETDTPRTPLCLPYRLWEDTISVAHHTGGHGAVASTVSRLWKAVYFPGMKREVEDFIANCQAESHQRRDQRQYHQARHFFLSGARVWLFTPQTATGEMRKLSRYWSGPWVACAQPVNDVMIRIEPHPSWQGGPSRVVSINRLRLYRTRTRGRGSATRAARITSTGPGSAVTTGVTRATVAPGGAPPGRQDH